jgi:lipopolysaccharide export LptBFGC system permease protein LptF
MRIARIILAVVLFILGLVVGIIALGIFLAACYGNGGGSFAIILFFFLSAIPTILLLGLALLVAPTPDNN